MADDNSGTDEGVEGGNDAETDAFDITVFGADHSELSDREKERVARQVHDLLQEGFDVRPDSVGVEGYTED